LATRRRTYTDYDAFNTDADAGPRFERMHRPRRYDEHEEDLPRRNRRGRDESKPFKCRKCKAFIGAPLTGGRHRNHCPACLHSLHVDAQRPGDRASDCRALMAPVGVFTQRNGEQSLVHRCLGCGIERHNRVAADDNPLLLMRLPLHAPLVAFAAELDLDEVVA
jgi:hypothetical protein